MPGWLAIVIGFVLVFVACLDVFWTVLYARSGKGVITPHLNAVTWRAFRCLANLFDGYKAQILGYCGPVMLVLTAGVWFTLVWIGFGMIFWPALGTGIQAISGPTPTGFMVAATYAGDCMTTVGSGELAPKSTFYRLMALVASVVGMSLITMAITYFLQVYNALLRRNTFALRIHHATANTGDAAELVGGLLGGGGDAKDARAALVTLAHELITMYESQHFYPNLVYFRFREPYYSLARVVQVTMDMVSLTRAALEPKWAGPLNGSAAVKQFWGGGKHLLVEFTANFLPRKRRPADPNDLPPPDEATAARWRRRYADAVGRLRAAGVPVNPDEPAGAAAYVELRRQWDAYMTAFAHFMADEIRDVDPPGYGGESDQRAPDPAGLNDRRFRAAG